MSMNYSKRTVFLALCFMLTGCGGEVAERPNQDITLFPITGTVTVNGTPAKGVSIGFQPPKGSKGVGGACISDDNGKFTVICSNGHEGLPVGNYYVVLTWLTSDKGEPIPEGAMAADYNAKNSLPDRFGSIDESPFNVTVAEGDNDPVTLDLKFKK